MKCFCDNHDLKTLIQKLTSYKNYENFDTDKCAALLRSIQSTGI